MRKSRFTEEQKTKILAEHRAGAETAELCRRYGISTKTFYGWRAKFGGLQGSEIRRMKEMEAQIARLQKIVAKQALELEVAQEIIKGKW
jgi:putative transposase